MFTGTEKIKDFDTEKNLEKNGLIFFSVKEKEFVQEKRRKKNILPIFLNKKEEKIN